MKTVWKKVKISSVCEGIYDGPHATPPISDTGFIFLGISNITEDGHLDLSSPKYINERDFPKWTKRITPYHGDIVFSYEATLNLYAIIPENFKGCLGRRMALIRPNLKKIDRKFLFYYFFSPEWRNLIFTNTITGATVDRISLINFPNFEISLPPLETQQKIAGILSAYDDLIENNRKQIKLLEEAAQNLYKEWFVKLNFPGHENVKIIDDVPEGWKFERIDSFIELLNGFAFKSDSFDDEGKYGIITIKNVQDGAFDSANVNRVKEVPSKMPDWCNLEIGDILLSLTGNVGRVCLVTSENCLLNQRVAKLKSEYPAYTYTLFRSKDMFIMMNNLANGAAQQNLSPIRTGEQKILKPTQEVISAFENLVSPYIKKELSLFIQIQLLQSARDKLLPKLMNGEFEV